MKYPDWQKDQGNNSVDLLNHDVWKELTEGLYRINIERMKWLLFYFQKVVHEHGESASSLNGSRYISLGTFLSFKRNFYHFLNSRAHLVNSPAIRMLLGRLDEHGMVRIKQENGELTIAVRIHKS